MRRLRLQMMAGELDPIGAFLAATGITNATIISALNTLYADLVGYGIWNKFLAIYPFVGGTSFTHKFNLVNAADTNSAFRLSFAGGLTHSSTGVLPNGVNGFADTFLRNDVLPIDDVHIAYYSRSNTAAANMVEIGSWKSGFNFGTGMYLRTAAGNFFGRVNGSGFINVANANSQGFYIATKNPATPNSIEFYKNLTQYVNSSAPAANYIDTTFKIFRPGDLNLEYTNRESAFASIGYGLTQTQANNYRTAVQAFQTTLGRQI
jgi:hypothetical protein